jgi:hypothetical protein
MQAEDVRTGSGVARHTRMFMYCRGWGERAESRTVVVVEAGWPVGRQAGRRTGRRTVPARHYSCAMQGTARHSTVQHTTPAVRPSPKVLPCRKTGPLHINVPSSRVRLVTSSARSWVTDSRAPTFLRYTKARPCGRDRAGGREGHDGRQGGAALICALAAGPAAAAGAASACNDRGQLPAATWKQNLWGSSEAEAGSSAVKPHLCQRNGRGGHGRHFHHLPPRIIHASSAGGSKVLHKLHAAAYILFQLGCHPQRPILHQALAAAAARVAGSVSPGPQESAPSALPSHRQHQCMVRPAPRQQPAAPRGCPPPTRVRAMPAPCSGCHPRSSKLL